LALCKIATLDGASVVVPTGVIGQVWRDGSRQAQIARLIEANGTIVETLDLHVAKLAGAYCSHAGTTDVVDATVVIAARQHHALIISSDRSDLHRLDPGIQIVTC